MTNLVRSIAGFASLLLSVCLLFYSTSAQSDPVGVCKDPKGCEVTNGPVQTGPTQPPAEMLILERQDQRFREVLRRLVELGVPDLTGLGRLSRPTSSAELDGRVQRIYVDAFRVRENLRSDLRDSSRYQNQIQARTKTLLEEIQDYQREINSAPETLTELRIVIKDGPANLARAEQLIAPIAATVVNSQKRAFKKREAVIRMISSLMLTDARADFELKMSSQPISPFELVKPRSGSVTVPSGLVATVPSRTPTATVMNLVAPRISGIEPKLNELESISRDLATLRTQQQRMSTLLGSAGRDLVELERRNERLRFEAGVARSEIERLKTIADPISERLSKASFDRYIHSENVYRSIMTELVWDHVKERVVEPQIRKFIRLNRLSAKADLIAAINEIRNNPKKLLAISGRLKGMEDFVNTQEKILNLIPLFTQYAEEAANRLGTGSWRSAQVLKGELERDLAGASAEVVESAGGQTDDPTAKLRAWLFTPLRKK